MQKKLMAVAVVGALSAPALALAQASTVQMYGRLVLEYGYADQGSGRPNADILQGPGGTMIGFKGEEKLGGGLSAWFQCESSADVRGVGQFGFCTQNSALGMKGGFGNVYMGTWDTPFKRVMLRGEVGAEDTGMLGVSNLLSGFSTSAPAGSGTLRTLWERRPRNMISYDTPNMSGFQGFVGYSADAATAAPTTTAPSPRVVSVGGVYDNGPLALGLSYERHNEFGSAGGTTQDDHAWALSGSYTFGHVKVGGSYNKQNYDLGAGLSSAKKSWLLGVTWAISGPHGLAAYYAKTDDISGNGGAIASGSPIISGVPAAGANTGATKLQIAYTHQFSKRTDAKLAYVRLNNDTNASYTLSGTGALTSAGQGQNAWVMLLRHMF